MSWEYESSLVELQRVCHAVIEQGSAATLAYRGRACRRVRLPLQAADGKPLDAKRRQSASEEGSRSAWTEVEPVPEPLGLERLFAGERLSVRFGQPHIRLRLGKEVPLQG